VPKFPNLGVSGSNPLGVASFPPFLRRQERRPWVWGLRWGLLAAGMPQEHLCPACGVQEERLRDRTKADYLQAKIETACGDLPLDALDDPRVTRDFLDWRGSNSSKPAAR